MSKWKVGDRVRLVGPEWDGCEEGFGVGSVVPIEKIDPCGCGSWRGWMLMSHEDPDSRDHAFSSRWETELVTSAPVTVKREDITLIEEQEVFLNWTSLPFYVWKASLWGSLSTGEDVRMERQGKTSTSALAALEGAIAEQGWEVE